MKAISAFIPLVCSIALTACAAEVADGLSSEDVKVQIRTLLNLANDGAKAREHEDRIAAMLEKSERGKALALWSLYALSRISDSPRKYVRRFRDAAYWKPPVDAPAVVRPPIQSADGSFYGGAVDTGLKQIDLALGDAPEDRAHAAKAWEGVIPVLVSAYTARSSDPNLNWDAQVCLTGLSMPVNVIRAELCKVLENEHGPTEKRVACAKLLGFLGASKEVSDVLLKHVASGDTRLRKQAAMSLGGLCRPFPKVVDGKVFWLQPHPDRDNAVSAITKLLTDPDPTVRSDATIGLEYMLRHAKDALPELKLALEKETVPKTVTWLKQAIRNIERDVEENEGKD